MRDQMLNHGLDHRSSGPIPAIFKWPFPGDNIERLRVPEKQFLITPAVKAILNERQKRIVKHV